MRSAILRSIAQVKRLLVNEFASLNLCGALFQCFSALTMVFFVFFSHGANLSLVFALDEVVIEELVHLGLGYPIVLQFVVHAELTLVFLLLFFFCIFVCDEFGLEHLNLVGEVFALDFRVELRKFEAILCIFLELFGLACDELPFDSQKLPFGHLPSLLALCIVSALLVLLAVVPPKASRRRTLPLLNLSLNAIFVPFGYNPALKSIITATDTDCRDIIGYARLSDYTAIRHISITIALIARLFGATSD